MTPTIDKPLEDLHFEVLRALDEFPRGLDVGGLQKAIGKMPVGVHQAAGYLSELGLARCDELTHRYQITMKGKAALKQPVLVRPSKDGALPDGRERVKCPVAGCETMVIADKNGIYSHMFAVHPTITGRERILIIEKVLPPPEDRQDIEDAKREFERLNEPVPDEPAEPSPLESMLTGAAPLLEDSEKEVKDEDDEYPIDIKAPAEDEVSHGNVPCDVEGCKFKAKSALGLAIHKARAHGKKPTPTESRPKPEKRRGKRSRSPEREQHYKEINELQARGLSPRNIASKLGVSLHNVYHMTYEMRRLGILQETPQKGKKSQTTRKVKAPREDHNQYYSEIKRLREDGKPNREIAAELHISKNLVASCIQDLIDRGEVKPLTHSTGEWCLSPEERKRREEIVIRGRAAGKSNNEIARGLGLSLGVVERIASDLILSGRIERKGPPPTTLRRNVLTEPIIPIGSAISTEPPGLIIEKVEGPTEYTPDPFAGLAKMLAELNAIPGVKVTVTISLGVSS